MPKREDLTGRRFSYLVAEEFTGMDSNGHALWLCRCDCGNTKIIPANKLKAGEYKSCGCMHRKYSHGQYNTRLYHIWCTMKARCTNPKSKKYHRYGGRGVTVCDEWMSDFQAFYDWAMANGYQEDLTIDRIDNDGNYCPDNCRWATNEAQCNNRGHQIQVWINGELKTLAQVAKESGLKYRTVHARYNRGWRGESLIKEV